MLAFDSSSLFAVVGRGFGIGVFKPWSGAGEDVRHADDEEGEKEGCCEEGGCEAGAGMEGRVGGHGDGGFVDGGYEVGDMVDG